MQISRLIDKASYDMYKMQQKIWFTVIGVQCAALTYCANFAANDGFSSPLHLRAKQLNQSTQLEGSNSQTCN